MRRTKAVSVGEALQEFFRQFHLQGKLDEVQLMNRWAEVAGANVQAYTRSLQIRRRILYVQVSSSALANNLALSRRDLVRRLNQSVGASVIDDIQFNRQ